MPFDGTAAPAGATLAGATLVSDARWPSWATTVRHDAGV